eukprot:TRINITY_DN1520_c0_g1_i6.p1 TRINITY_DN1520_c0_g1~~TRINITY_DN1520_c0_g1_i6.p1  ORF type:complete len:1072 (+),score=226.11 TRINITY_DN1520_c0_g1_i6:58-3216(+)
MVVRLSFTLALVLLALVAVSMVAAVLLGQHTTTKVLDDDEATRDAALDICFAGGRKSSTAVTEDVLTAQVRAIKESTRLFLTETSGAVSMMVQMLSTADGDLLNSRHYLNTTWRALQAAAFVNARKRGSPIRELVSFRVEPLASFFTLDLASGGGEFVVQVDSWDRDFAREITFGGMLGNGTIYPGECNFDAALAAGDATRAGVCKKYVRVSEFVDGDGWLHFLTHDIDNGTSGWWTTGTYPNMITENISATSLGYFASFSGGGSALRAVNTGKLVGGIGAYIDISRLSQSVLSTLQLRGQQRVYVVQIHPVTLSVDAIVVTSHGELDDPRGYLLNSKRDVVAADDAVIRAHGQYAMNYTAWTEADSDYYETYDGMCWEALLNLPGKFTLDSCANLTRKIPRCLQEFVLEFGGTCYCVTGEAPCLKVDVAPAVYRVTDSGVELVGRKQELVCDASLKVRDTRRRVEECGEAVAQTPQCGDHFTFRYDDFRSWACTCALWNATCTIRNNSAATARTFMWSTPNTPAPDRAYEQTYLRDPIGRKYTAMLNGAEWWVHQELLESDGVKLHVVALLESDEALREINQGVEDSKTLITAETAATRSSKDEAFLLHWLISAVLCVVFASIAVVLPGRMLRPLEALGTDMASVALLRTDDVDVKGPLSFFLEVRSMQSSFRVMHECVHAYRAFIPTAAIVDEDSIAGSCGSKDDESSMSQKRKSGMGSRSPTVGEGEMVEKAVRVNGAESKQKYGTMLTSNRGGFLHMIREMDSQAMSAALCSMVELFVSTCTLHHGIVDVLQADHLSAHFGYLRQCATHRKAAAECASDLRPAASSDVVTLPIYCTCTSGIAWAGHFGSADTRRFMIIGGVASFSIVLERIATSRRFVVLVDKRVHDDIQTHWDCCARYNLRYPKRGSAAPVPVFEMMRRKVRKCGDGMCEWMYELGSTEANPWQAVNDAMEQWLGGHPGKALATLTAAGAADEELRIACVQLVRQIEELGPAPTVTEAELSWQTKAEWSARGHVSASATEADVLDRDGARLVWGRPGGGDLAARPAG